jgi:hypothetical protein
MQSNSKQKSIAFFDTNALLDMFGYWAMCQACSLNLNQYDQFQKMLSEKFGINNDTAQLHLSKRDIDTVNLGMDLFKGMTLRIGNWDFFTSRVCLSEMRHTLLEDRASERLIELRVPYRLRRERPLILYRRSLRENDYSNLDSEVNGFFDLLIDHGIIIQIAEEGATNFTDVAIVAEKIWSHVLFEVMDAFVLASAVTSMADILITRDGAFRDAVQRLANPPDTEWRCIRDSLSKIAGFSDRGYSWPEARSVQNPFP